ncbi:zinc finger protein ZPR1-like [Camellia sinensis]|uniref:zinc finger protein ZPR1-like n=1 Tax=Camellia sinensis TaxID=4442 RepID=UPI0010362A34|nr:zinc finger protein ZPR1-like [Camellia sinensis]
METNNNSIMDVRSVVDVISSDDNDAPLYQVESLCMRCHQNGTTRFLLTLIPHFRKILLSAFECPHCGERLVYLQFAGELQPRGCHYQLNFPPGDQKMLNRQVVKTDTATIKIPELDFEIPPEAQRGSLSTVEGILLRAADEIEALQEERKKVDPQSAEAINRFLPKLRACAKGESSFTIILDDPAGNSFIENPFAPSPDPSSIIKFYERTPKQQASLGRLQLGYVVNPSLGGEHCDEALLEELNSTGDQTRREPHGLIGATAGQQAIAQGNSAEFAESLFRYSAPEDVMTFPSTCGTCAAKCETRMFVTSILLISSVIEM